MAEGPPGRKILAGRWSYDTDDRLPSGQTARTYGGIDLETEEEVVVKISNDVPGARGRYRFRREARLHEELDHEAILPLLDHGIDEGSHYIVTRRLRPGSLWNVLREDPTLSLATVCSVGTRIAGALAYMHGRKEVHGDISPGNILLDAKRNAYLADFGFSKRVETTPLATSGDAYGTAGFRAPREPGSARTYEDDIYSLAAVLWFCLTGDAPSHWERARKRELPNRALRAPLERALRWGRAPAPTAEDFAAGLEKGWRKAAQDWRLETSRRRASPALALMAAGLGGLVLALSLGQIFKPKPVRAAEATISRGGVTLHLTGNWRQKQPPRLPAFQMQVPIAAGSGRTTIVAGRAPIAGSALISSRARKTLPLEARKGHPVQVGERAALSYGPANQFGGSVEVLTMPLARSVLVIRCGGPAPTLERTCAQVAGRVTLAKGVTQPLAPNQDVARRMHAAVADFAHGREPARAELSIASDPMHATLAARRLVALSRSLSRRFGSLPVNAQDMTAIHAVEVSALDVATGYERLADASTVTAWTNARKTILRKERQLELAIENLRDLRVFPTRA